MSLAPRERQALSAIETGLRASDPIFAILIARLAGQLSRGQEPGRTFSLRRSARLRPSVKGSVLIVIATLLLAFCIAVTIVATHAGHAGSGHVRATVSATAPTHGMPFPG